MRKRIENTASSVGEIDALLANLLREGLDLPEKFAGSDFLDTGQSFLRNERVFTQTMTRAAYVM